MENAPRKSRPTMGLVEVKTSGFKQDGAVVITFRRSILVYKRDQGPRMATPAMA